MMKEKRKGNIERKIPENSQETTKGIETDSSGFFDVRSNELKFVLEIFKCEFLHINDIHRCTVQKCAYIFYGTVHNSLATFLWRPGNMWCNNTVLCGKERIVI